MAAIGKWLGQILLGWLLNTIRELVQEYLKLRQLKRERAEENAKAEEKLKNAEPPSEVIDAGSDLLKR